MHRPFAVLLLGIAATLPLDVKAAEKHTFGNELGLRDGYHAIIDGDNQTDYNWVYRGFSDVALAYNYTDPTGYHAFDGCNAYCAPSEPYGLAFNSTQPAGSVNITSLNFANIGAIYSIYGGCYNYGQNGTTSTGKPTYGRVAQNCTIKATATTYKGKKLSHSWDAHWQIDPIKGKPNSLTFTKFPATFRNMTVVSFSATAKATKQLPYPPAVALDDVTYI